MNVKKFLKWDAEACWKIHHLCLNVKKKINKGSVFPYCNFMSNTCCQCCAETTVLRPQHGATQNRRKRRCSKEEVLDDLVASSEWSAAVVEERKSRIESYQKWCTDLLRQDFSRQGAWLHSKPEEM